MITNVQTSFHVLSMCVCQDDDEDEKDKGESAADGSGKTKKKKKKKKKAAEEAAGQVTASENYTNIVQKKLYLRIRFAKYEILVQ